MDGEKRHSRRRHLKYPATIDFHDGRPVRRCALSDVSAVGARVVVDDPTEVPDEVTLLLGTQGASRVCRVAWRRDGEVGLQFVVGARV